MEKLMNKVIKLLSDRFKEAEIEVEPMSSGSKITGTVIWKGFSRYDQLGRQHLLDKIFENALTLEERKKITLILTMTPREAGVVRT